MADRTYEENYKIYWATAVADINAPTLVEIQAATRFTKVTKDGWAPNFSENAVDTSDIDTAYDSEVPGSWKAGPIAITMKRDDTDESYTYDLMVRNSDGFIIASPFGVPQSGSKVMVFPARIGITQHANSAANEAQKFTTQFFVTSEPALRAIVDGS